jgi:hypothetical protein
MTILFHARSLSIKSRLQKLVKGFQFTTNFQSIKKVPNLTQGAIKSAGIIKPTAKAQRAKRT